MPHDRDSWERMEPLWRSLTEEAACDVYVMPVPYYLKNGTGEPDEFIV